MYTDRFVSRLTRDTLALILAGDHVYKMDYGPMLAFHVERQADLTVGCIKVPIEEAGAFGVMSVTGNERIQSFTEKPAKPPAMPGKPDTAMASMGIYVFRTEYLMEQLIQDSGRGALSSHDFGKDIIPAVIEDGRVFAYPFHSASTGTQAYWRDVGTIDTYWKANLELIGVTPELNLYDKDWPIWTAQEHVPPSKFVFDDDHRRGMAVDSMVSGGAIIAGATIRHSLLFTNVTVDDYSTVENSVILPDVRIGRNCRIKNAIIDKRTVIPDNTEIGLHPEKDAWRFYLSPGGVVLVTPDMMGQKHCPVEPKPVKKQWSSDSAGMLEGYASSTGN